MSKTRKYWIGAGCVALGLYLPALASAVDQVILPMAACTLVSNASVALPTQYSTWANFSEGNQWVIMECGLGQDRALDSNDDVRVYYTDANSNVDTVDNYAYVFCHGYEVDEDWSSAIYAGSRYSCVTPGGCNTNSGFFAGDNYLNIPDLNHGGQFAISMRCYLPRKMTTNGAYSYIKTFMIDQQ